MRPLSRRRIGIDVTGRMSADILTTDFLDGHKLRKNSIDGFAVDI